MSEGEGGATNSPRVRGRMAAEEAHGESNSAMRDAIDFLSTNHVMSLATVAAGTAHVVSLMYAHDGLTLIWLSDPKSRHSRCIEENPRVAACIAPDYADFEHIRGLQLTGVARRLVQPVDAAGALSQLRARYTFLARISDDGSDMAHAYEESAAYSFTPTSIVWINNDKGFARKCRLPC